MAEINNKSINNRSKTMVSDVVKPHFTNSDGNINNNNHNNNNNYIDNNNSIMTSPCAIVIPCRANGL